MRVVRLSRENIVRLASIFTQFFTCGAHVEDTNLTKVRAGFQGSHYRFTVVRHHLQPTPVHDVHLLAHLACEWKDIQLGLDEMVPRR